LEGLETLMNLFYAYRSGPSGKQVSGGGGVFLGCGIFTHFLLLGSNKILYIAYCCFFILVLERVKGLKNPLNLSFYQWGAVGYKKIIRKRAQKKFPIYTGFFMLTFSDAFYAQ